MKSGYEKPVSEFKDLLKDQFKIMKKFLSEELDLHLRSKDTMPFITDLDGHIIEMDEVHQMIQGDERLQRQLYNIWMTTYR